MSREMSIKELKSFIGLILAILISIIFVYFVNSHWHFSDLFKIFCLYFVLLAISFLIFYTWLGMQWFLIPFIPIFIIVFYLFYFIQRKIRKCLLKNGVKQNVRLCTVVIVTNFNWYNIEYYINASPTYNDVKIIVEYLLKYRKDFSFYLKPSKEDIDKVMSDSKVREVYFLGHGNSDKFQINVNEVLEYKNFNDKKYYKDFVHQVHCGSKNGRPLRYYIVPKKNWRKCFFFRKGINEEFIVNYFKRAKS